MALRFADFEIEDTWQWLYGQGMPKRVRLDLKIDDHFGLTQKAEKHPRAPSGFPAKGPDGWHNSAQHPDAARFVGWDRASRPGWEPIIVAVQPSPQTVPQVFLFRGGPEDRQVGHHN